MLLITLLYITTAYQYACPVYQCNIQPANNMCLLNLNNGTLNSSSCSTKTYCTLNTSDSNLYCLPAKSATNIAYPGEMCNSTSNCLGGAKCNNGVCIGSCTGSICSSDIECDVDLFCSPITSTCTKLSALNSPCNITFPCQSHLFCDIYSDTCLLKGSLQKYQNAPSKWACQTFFAIRVGNVFQCWDPPTFVEDTNNTMLTKQCSIGSSNCEYVTTSGVAVHKECECAYTSTGGNSGYCPIAEGAMRQNLTNLMNYVANFTPHCHIRVPLVCFSQVNWNNSNFNAAWLTVQNIWGYPIYQGNDDCTKNSINQMYFLMQAQNYIPVSNNSNNTGGSNWMSSFGFLALLICAM